MSGRCALIAGVGGAAAALLLAACGTTGQPTQQSIWVETPDCPAASCQLRNDRGEWTLPRTPGRVTVVTSKSPLEVTCRAGDVRTTSSAPPDVPPSSGGGALAGAALGGGAMAAATAGAAAVGMAPVAAILVLWGAVAGAGVGAAAEGATRPWGYPEWIAVPLRCGPERDGPRFGFTVRGLTDQEARAAGRPDAGAARVTAVAEGSRAAAAGLRPGDVVTAANGIAIDGAARLEALARATPPGQALVLRIERDGESRDVRLEAP